MAKTNIYELIVENAPNMIWMSGLDKKCYYFNRTWLKFTGRSMEEEQGDGWVENVHLEDLERCIKVYTEHFDKREAFYMEYRLRRSDGEFRWISDRGTPIYDGGEFLGYLGSCMDIHEKIIGKKVIDMAYYDGLTRLNSRQYFIEQISELIDHYHREGEPFTLALLDLDDFKLINDRYGHRSGDIVLMKVAEVLKGSIRGGDIAARYGGDEFVLLLKGADEVVSNTIINRIEEEITSLEFNFNKQVVHISASIGLSEFTPEFTLEQFIIDADQQMYSKKKRRHERL
ncbi:sensor domain-containing diguanylate cyclase [Fusibacter sp. 3D3]|uniref:sensor domain-containing diguanylate cyclase n=1 Tax=Fusibacter sp. 3D3 TaxID=1048380 RepID=UPI000853B564|nr:sensor domain-containing diguanylate cyclase [Fusibacter sp. 3D3]GAU77560.1 sensory transduction histidine kinase [Fusibacter sp. 3D3]